MTEPRMPKTRRLTGAVSELTNAETGEVIPLHGEIDITVPASPGRAHRRKQRSHPMFALVDSISAAKLELTQHEGRVFWIIVGSINPHTGESRVKGAEIARTIDTTPSNVSRILANLKRRRVIFANGQSCWTVNPWIAFYGSAEDWERITDDYKQPEWNRS